MSATPPRGSDPLPLEDADALAGRAASGDSPALTALCELYMDRTKRDLYFRVRNHADAEDLCQEVWLKIAQKIGSFKPDGPGGFAAWHRQIIRNMVIDAHRMSQRRPIITSDMLDLDWPSPDLSPAEWHENRLKSERTAAMLKTLRADQCECLTLRIFDGYSLEETARLMGKNVNAIKQLQWRGVRRLQQRFYSNGPVPVTEIPNEAYHVDTTRHATPRPERS